MSRSFRTSFERARAPTPPDLDPLEQARAELSRTIVAIDAAAAGPPPGLRVRLRAVEDLLCRYALEAWRPGGLLRDLLAEAPWLTPRIDAHCRRLARATARVAGLAADVEGGGGPVAAGGAELADALTRVAVELDDLSADETDLIVESDDEPSAID